MRNVDEFFNNLYQTGSFCVICIVLLCTDVMTRMNSAELVAFFLLLQINHESVNRLSWHVSFL